MPYHWPADTDFALWELDVLDRDCPACGRQDVHLRSPLSPLSYPRRPGGTGLQAQSLPRSPLPRARQDQEPRTRDHHRPALVGDRLGCLLLDRPSTVLAPLVDPPDPIRTPGRLRDQALGRRHRPKYIRRYQVMLAARQQDADVAAPAIRSGRGDHPFDRRPPAREGARDPLRRAGN